MPETKEVLENSENMLRMAYAGYKQYQKAEGQAKMVGLRNVVVWGRSVTFVLQKLRGPLGKQFDDWYDERIEVFENDDVLSRMSELRNKILKEGVADTSTYGKIDHLNTADLREWAPPWADTIFLGDEYGGSGWSVELPDGSSKKFYADLPEEIQANFELSLRSEGELIPAEDDLEFYVKVLGEMVSDAKKEFGEQEELSQ